jgi:hypothetical protein
VLARMHDIIVSANDLPTEHACPTMNLESRYVGLIRELIQASFTYLAISSLNTHH